MAKFPPEVKAFHDAMLRIPGIVDVSTGLKDLAEFTPDTYSFPGEFGDLPHALLRRTNGGLENEAWANTEFETSKDGAGWIAIEFVAWWVRDMSRSKEQIQLRTMALPPVAGKKQLGTTLRFIIDHFIICPGGDTAVALTMIQNRAESLNDSIDEYQELLGPPVETPRKKGWFGRTK